jgi:hypothetical protein
MEEAIYSFFNIALDGVFDHRHAPAALYLGKRQEAGWTQVTVWTKGEDITPTGIRSPDSPAHSEALYRQKKSQPTHILK